MEFNNVLLCYISKTLIFLFVFKQLAGNGDIRSEKIDRYYVFLPYFVIIRLSKTNLLPICNIFARSDISECFWHLIIWGFIKKILCPLNMCVLIEKGKTKFELSDYGQ